MATTMTMHNTHVAVCATSFLAHPSLLSELRARLQTGTEARAGTRAELHLCPPRSDTLASELTAAHVALVGREKVDASSLAAAGPQLRAIVKYGVGCDNIDFAACRRAGVAVHVARGVNRDAVAEHCLGLMLALSRRIAASDRRLRTGTWLRDGGTQLSGKTIGIVGVGAIGSRVADLARAFRCPLLLCDIRPIDAPWSEARQVSLATLLAESDVVTLHVPLDDSTRGMIGAAELATMRPEAMLINTARGGLIDEQALAAALAENRLAGAAADAFADESGAPRHLLASSSFVATPHSAAACPEAVLAMGRGSIDLLEQALLPPS